MAENTVKIRSTLQDQIWFIWILPFVGFCRSSLPLLLNFNRWGNAFNSLSPLFEELGVTGSYASYEVKPNMQHLLKRFRIHIDSCDVMPVELVPKALLHPGSEIWNGGQNRTGFPKVTSLFRPQLARFLVPNCSSAIYLASHKTQSCTDLALSMRQPKNQATNCDQPASRILQLWCLF